MSKFFLIILIGLLALAIALSISVQENSLPEITKMQTDQDPLNTQVKQTLTKTETKTEESEVSEKIGNITKDNSTQVQEKHDMPLKTDQVSLWTRALSLPGESAVNKRAYEIPDGWRVADLSIVKQKGRARVYEQDGFVILEVHALSLNKFERAEAFAEASIKIIQEEP